MPAPNWLIEPALPRIVAVGDIHGDLEIVGGDVTPRYFDRGDGELELTRTVRAEGKARRAALHEF